MRDLGPGQLTIPAKRSKQQVSEFTPENGWLDFLISFFWEIPYFQGYVSFREGKGVMDVFFCGGISDKNDDLWGFFCWT